MNLSAYSEKKTEFLSHPIEEKKHSLIDHSIAVAKKTEEIYFDTGFSMKNSGFYAGLLHDIGKLNAYYQQLFYTDREYRKFKEEELLKTYERMHSPLSSWAASKLLSKKISEIDNDTIDKVIMIIYGHHGKLLNSIPNSEYISQTRFGNSHNSMSKKLPDFYNQVKSISEFFKLDWEKCFRLFQIPPDFQINLRSDKNNYIYDFLQVSLLFSSLLQADKGSFEEWLVPTFDIEIDTSNLVRFQSKLGDLRNRFQEEVQINHNKELDICILNAPTGIGKTKVFLDLIDKYNQSSKEAIERVFYFSPLLALTEDFEKKLRDTVKDKQEDILVYNHLFSGNLIEKDQKESGVYEEEHWFFPYESFNMKFIVTTTQRLLITLYSNRSRDKLKLASFKNSILIIDEVQTIPKFLLPNLVNLLKNIAKKMRSKIILVSATIPHELKSIPRIKISEHLIQSYLIKTQKKITFQEQLMLSNPLNKKVLIMSNTRRKAVNIFKDITSFLEGKKIYQDTYNENNIFYISSGIRKKDRIKLVEHISKIGTSLTSKIAISCILVSTQVVEAGVDISFSEIYREVAPIDNIIQVMGRLNREGKDDNALLSVFQNDNDHRPYSQLEYNESLPILRQVKSSDELYKLLNKYYETITTKNKLNESKAQLIERYMIDLDFNKIWEFVNNNVMPDDGDNLFVPENKEQWNEIKYEFTKEKINKNVFKKFAELTASIPKSLLIDFIKNFCDEELLKRNILLPKFELLDEIYDKKIGLDKWLLK